LRVDPDSKQPLPREEKRPVFKRLWDSSKEFLVDVRGEVKKVSFPTRAETLGSTIVVIVFCVIMSLYLSVVDSFLVWLVSKVI
jgi:preprotein translocase subunit SecE